MAEEEKKPEEKKESPVDSLKKNENVQKVLDFAQSNTGDTITYILLFVGILLLIFKPMWGGLIIGGIGGFYFSEAIITWINGFKEYLEKEGLIKVLIILGIALGIFINNIWIFIGAAAAVGVRYLMKSGE